MMFSKLRITYIANSVLNLAETKFNEYKPRATKFVLRFANLKSRDILGHLVMPRTEVRVRALASHEEMLPF